VRRIISVAVLPALPRKASTSVKGPPSTERISSPFSMPAAAAGAPSKT
jgi:hypothetical protein